MSQTETSEKKKPDHVPSRTVNPHDAYSAEELRRAHTDEEEGKFLRKDPPKRDTTTGNPNCG